MIPRALCGQSMMRTMYTLVMMVSNIKLLWGLMVTLRLLVLQSYSDHLHLGQIESYCITYVEILL